LTLVWCSVLIGLNILVQWAALLPSDQDVRVQILALKITTWFSWVPLCKCQNTIPNEATHPHPSQFITHWSSCHL